ncbi:uncharacterized protein LOC134276835 [Saccostrea cucullata]|uniref:uncharacterized protein LOC134276835 n=1 Tax=Saccostrea cuccullata TaxID=36930 RepID=UPI002ED4B20D
MVNNIEAMWKKLLMKSQLIPCLFVCLLVIDVTLGRWEISGGVSAGNTGWKAEVKVTFKWGKRKKRATKLQIFDVVMFMVNTKSESSVRVNPCDYALYDQDGDLEVTMTDFDIIFDHNVANKHQLVERMFAELDDDKDNKISLMEFENKKHEIISPQSCKI